MGHMAAKFGTRARQFVDGSSAVARRGRCSGHMGALRSRYWPAAAGRNQTGVAMRTTASYAVDAGVTSVEGIQALASAAFVPLRISTVGEAGFRARFRGMRVNDLVVARVRSTAAEVRRDDAAISTVGGDVPRMLKVALHQHGRGHVAQAGRECAVKAGDLVAYETGQPYQMRFPEAYDTVVVGIPWSALGPHAELLGGRTARAVPTAAGTRPLVANLLTGLTELSDPGSGVGEEATPSTLHLADALVSLIVATFAEVAPAHAETGSDITDRILAYCQANLGDPGLSLESVAGAHGVSVSYVQKRMRARGITLGAWIRRQRLHRIRRDLQDPSLSRRSSAAIAARWGIMDATHLGRALKAEYGTTLSQLRDAARPC